MFDRKITEDSYFWNEIQLRQIAKMEMEWKFQQKTNKPTELPKMVIFKVAQKGNMRSLFTF